MNRKAPNSKRKLAAVLFADIVGYTLLMQQDEARASNLLRHFQTQLEEKVISHNGRVVNFYGDGALCTFEIPIDAVRCAMTLQSTFVKDPAIPVRIGIHSGTVTLEGAKIFGDSVNIASRIETMGVAGAILVSKKVRDEVKNNPDLRIQSLGSFEFKNVEEPMEVFALANEGIVVPKKEEIQGKLKSKASKMKWTPIAFAFLGLLLIAGYFFYKNQGGLLPDEILESRIAVLPFENKTNDISLDVVGDMAADWIIEGLMNMEEVKVVSFQNVKSSLKYASVGKESNSRSDFQKLTGAEKIIQGNFYKLNKQLIFKSQIINVISGEVDLVLEEISGSEDDISELINTLKSKIMGYFAARKDLVFNILTRKPPKYEAYLEFKEADKYFGVDYEKTLAQYKKAIRLDSTFFFAYMNLLVNYTNSGNYYKGDSVLQVIEKRFKVLSPFEKLNLNWIKALVNRDIKKVRDFSIQIHQKDPKNHIYNYLAGYYEANLNNPAAALPIFEKIDTTILPKLLSSNATTWWNEVYAHCLIRLNRFDEALKVLDWVPEELTNRDYFRLKIQIHVFKNQPEKIAALIRQVEGLKRPITTISDMYRSAAIAYGLSGDITNQTKWAKLGVEFLNNQPEGSEGTPYHLAEAYYLSGQFEKTLPLFTQLNKNGRAGSIYGIGKWHHLSRIGCSLIKMGEKEEALKIIEDLENVDDPVPSGRYTYAIARIYAQLGDKAKATQYLKQAMDEGFVNEYGEFRYGEDIDFTSLKGYEPFENFVLAED